MDSNNNLFQTASSTNKKDSISSSIHELENINNQHDSDILGLDQDSGSKIQRSVSVRPETPLQVTHNADFDDDDEDEV